MTARPLEVRLSELVATLSLGTDLAGNHVEHVYAKIGASNRARAGLFAMQHGLMADAAALRSG